MSEEKEITIDKRIADMDLVAANQVGNPYPEVRTIGQVKEMILDFPSSLVAANFFKSFADGTRLRILQALSIKELCVSDLCELLELSQPAISNHLRVLNNQRIIKFRRSGKNIFYSLDDWHINGIIGMGMEHLNKH